MHEYGLMEDIVAHAAEEAWRGGRRRVTFIRIEVGELSSASVDALTAAFEALSRGTTLEGAKLEVSQVPGKLRCDACDFCGSLRDAGQEPTPPWVCPECGYLLRAVDGKDILLAEIS